MAKKQSKRSVLQLRNSEKWRVKGMVHNMQEFLENSQTLRPDEIRRVADSIQFLDLILEGWDAI